MQDFSCSIALKPEALDNYQAQLRLSDTTNAISQLALAIAENQYWQEFQSVQILFRETPYPAIAVMGQGEASQISSIQSQLSLLNHSCQYLRYITEEEVTSACQQLAGKLKASFSREQLANFQFRAIPRGGLLILGRLAYLLDLHPEQLQDSGDRSQPLVLVDDCALSGGRFAHTLKTYSDRPIIFAPLFSAPELRKNILQHSQVIHCFSGLDLIDHSQELLNKTPQSWIDRQIKQVEGHRFWLGLTDYICFPWNEPDQILTHANQQSPEKAWRIVPSHLCLKNRPNPENTIPIPATQITSAGAIQANPDMMWHTFSDRVLFSDIKNGSSFAMTRTAAHFWQTLVEHSSLEHAIISLARQHHQSTSIMQLEVLQFLRWLMQQQLIINANTK